MEGTREGMSLALPTPTCSPDGSFLPTQCNNDTCWCVDHFGTEIPQTRNPTPNCTLIPSCPSPTCRLGCDYGYVLSEDGCPTCQCRDPCTSIQCEPDDRCQLVEVSCDDRHCPPVPVCLPRKAGQCPYLVPAAASCDFECSSDSGCNGTERCCSNG